MVRTLVAAGIVAISAMVAVTAMHSRVAPPEARPFESLVVPTSGAQPAGSRVAPDAPIGSLQGEVRDVNGQPVPGAVVDATHEASGWRDLVLTNRQGAFTMARVPAGRVTLVARKDWLEITMVAEVVAGHDTAVVVRAQATREALTRGNAGAAGPPVATMPFPRTMSEAVSGASVQMQGRAAQTVQGSRADAWGPTNMDAYARVDPSGYRRVTDAPLSTFSIDVDTASYSNARRFLVEGSLPPPDAVRVEEWINYFSYAYPAPTDDEAFSVSTAVTACPWNADHQLLRVGVRGRDVPRHDTQPRNLVFLVDVSGSMMSTDKLPLVKTALKMLADQLTARDRIALVVYAGSTGLVLPSTPGDQRARIHDALNKLEAGGSTNGAGGIQLAYQTAHEGFIKEGVNRVVLATDGDFNVGITSLGDLTRLIEEERSRGVFLSVLGVGRGNLKDATLEQLADRGNGNYAYVDSLAEARRVLVEQIGATLVTIAKDVKLQVEFNPRHVAAYRLIGYENRALQTEDFADDRKDAGEIGAGHRVTALYEIVPPGKESSIPGASTTLRYQQAAPAATTGREGELATVSVRHKAPDSETSRLQSYQVAALVAEADAETAFAAAVAEAALVLRRDTMAGSASLGSAVRRAASAQGADAGGWRAEFVRLMQLAAALQALETVTPSEP